MLELYLIAPVLTSAPLLATFPATPCDATRLLRRAKVLDVVSATFRDQLLHNVTRPPFWCPNSMRKACMLCDIKFSTVKRKHHCRHCGRYVARFLP